MRSTCSHKPTQRRPLLPHNLANFGLLGEPLVGIGAGAWAPKRGQGGHRGRVRESVRSIVHSRLAQFVFTHRCLLWPRGIRKGGSGVFAAGLALNSFCSNMSHKHVLLRLDNTTAVAYLNAMGGVKSSHCNEAATQIWNWCIERNIWITAAHLAGRDNVGDQIPMPWQWMRSH